MDYEVQKSQLGDLLEHMCVELDLTPSQYEDARNKYQAVGEWLAVPGSSLETLSPEVYPQGSIRLGTVVKPLGKDEFDIDLVCQILLSPDDDQELAKQIVGGRLSENQTYKRMLREKNRCWRLDYAGQFHMDVLPAIPDPTVENCSILVPDRDLDQWKESNPKGYAQWFATRMEIARRQILKAMAAVEDLPDDDPQIKTPLQRSVQILKRHRDIDFENRKEQAPISIVITTLAAKAYGNETHLYDALIRIIDGMPNQIEYENGHPVVLNPTNRAENFAEKWVDDPMLYHTFLSWLAKLKETLEKLLRERSLDRIAASLNPLFGEPIIKSTMAAYAKKMESKRQAGSLRASTVTGTLGGTGITVKRNTFYGS